jgi:ribosomal protein S18 acetylase RimI-like enzyme
MTIRAAVAADIDPILRFWPFAGASPSPTDSDDDLRRLIGRDQCVLLVAEDGGTIVGTLLATFDGWRGHVYRLAVDPTRRRRGIARALVEDAEGRLRSWGARRAIALVELDHPWAISFWDALGYAHDPKMQRHAKSLDTLPAGTTG